MNKAPTSDRGVKCSGKDSDKTRSWPKPTTYTVTFDANGGPAVEEIRAALEETKKRVSATWQA